MRRALAVLALGARDLPTSGPPEDAIERVPAGTQDCVDECPTFPRERCVQWLSRFAPIRPAETPRFVMEFVEPSAAEGGPYGATTASIVDIVPYLWSLKHSAGFYWGDGAAQRHWCGS